MSAQVDLKELDKFTEELVKFTVNEYPKETKKFVRKEASSARTIAKRLARSRISKKTGNYLKGLKTSRSVVSKYDDTVFSRVYAGIPAYHGHLIEYGHEVHAPLPKGKGSKATGKRTRAFNILEDANEQYKNTFYSNSKNYMDKLVDKI